MKSAYQQKHASQLEKILNQLPKSSDAMYHRFAQQFFARVPISDLEQYDTKHVLALAASAYEFIQKRAPGQPKIRIFIPNKREHGYDSRNTVIELLNDDMPFLVDSLSSELTRHGLTIRETLHPIITVSRDKTGKLQALAGGETTAAESLIHFETSVLPEDLTPEQLTADLNWVLEHIRAAVADWRAITKKISAHIDALGKIGGKDVAEIQDFLRWLDDRNFIFLGYGEYDFAGSDKKKPAAGSRLGILKITDEAVAPELEHFLHTPHLVEITKSSRRSPIHRPVPMDVIAVKRFDAKGKAIGEARFLGLFTSNVYYQGAEAIPLVRRKIARAMERSSLDPASHDGKALKAIFEFLPRDEIFQMSDDELFDIGMGILALEAKPGVRVFIRRDAFERFVSAMVFVPRERFSTDLRYQIQATLEKAFNATSSSFSTQITEAPLARLHVILKTSPGDIPSVDLHKIEQDIARRAYLWSESLLDALIAKHGEQKAGKLKRIYGAAFPQGYINRYDSGAAVYDIGKIEEALESQGLALELFKVRAEDDATVHLKIYNPNEEIALSDILPMLENAGFRAIDEHPFLITPQGGAPVWIRDFKLRAASPVALDKVKPLLEVALLNIWRDEMENDGFNALVAKAGLTWRQVVLLRAYAKYLKQIGFTYAQSAIGRAMNQQSQIAVNIVALFETRFGLAVKDRESKQKALQEMIEKQLADVSNVAEDRILRRYVEVMLASVRTNYFQPRKPVLSFKLLSAGVPELPKPVPYAEIFVYSPRVEGIHLRGGKVARGGLRWSDRHEDFRTEVLGLMKAQMVKNSVIVPVGSKGGFVLKRVPSGREALMEEGIACYKMYLSGLLDLTDNIVGGKVTPPSQLVRHDEDDPYLVVAADKGTATFSDIANGVSAEYGFWLGDAFASGGSAGYDHKKMGITARGAWVSVARHFREMGVDIVTQDFTCTGIGDMSGDVFGNGMLLSNRLKLIAAFNHVHIFLDPNPDPKTSFAERQRLFKLPRSGWKDYDAKLISKGGGVFDRSAKSIAVSKEMQAALGITKSSLVPDDLIRAILLAPVDLLWNGGIGTYVKAEDESNEVVGDRTNNAMRVNGRDLRCKVVGEGGNLGFTQKGRIEYARAGGRLNTDAIDNSAGVDCSDHEVNIKIAFSHEVMSGKLSMEKRDRLLATMTDNVADLVLKDNILQTQAITLEQLQAPRLLESHVRLMEGLERQGLLDRALEFLPTDKQLAELKASKTGLTRPELAVLLAYGKMALYRDLLESTLPDEPYFASDLERYFPKLMQKDFARAIAAHRLKREIIATVVTNSLINRAGITFVFDIAEDLSVSPRDIAAAYALARDAFSLRSLWEDIEAASPGIPQGAQREMHGEIYDFMGRMTVWLLRNFPLPLDIDLVNRTLAPGIVEISKQKDRLHSEITRQVAVQVSGQLEKQGLPPALAERIAGLKLLSSACDIITIAQATGRTVLDVGRLYFALGVRLQFGLLREAAGDIAVASRWDRQALYALTGDMYYEQRRITQDIIEQKKSIDQWAEVHSRELERFDRFLADLKAEPALDISKLLVALRHIRAL